MRELDILLIFIEGAKDGFMCQLGDGARILPTAVARQCLFIVVMGLYFGGLFFGVGQRNHD